MIPKSIISETRGYAVVQWNSWPVILTKTFYLFSRLVFLVKTLARFKLQSVTKIMGKAAS